jgi:anti-sigma factor RsiW
LGPLTIVAANSDKPDLAMRTEHRQDLDLVYWRRYGHAYAVTAEGEVGNLRKVANEIAAQLDRI